MRRQQREFGTKLGLIGLFLALFAALAPRRSDRGDHEIGILDWTMLSIASLRAGRLISYDLVTEPIRDPFTETKDHPSGAGEMVVPKGSGATGAIGELLSCPICSGTWAAAALAFFLRLAPRPARFFLAILSATGVAEILSALLEALEWSGEAERKQAGSE
jgi:hypothetical protein